MFNFSPAEHVEISENFGEICIFERRFSNGTFKIIRINCTPNYSELLIFLN